MAKHDTTRDQPLMVHVGVLLPEFADHIAHKEVESCYSALLFVGDNQSRHPPHFTCTSDAACYAYKSRVRAQGAAQQITKSSRLRMRAGCQ